MTPRPCPDPATLEALLEDALPANRQAELAEHLEGCPECRTRLDDLAMPAQFRLAQGDSDAVRSLASARVPTRRLVELWQRQADPTGSTSQTSDATAAVLARLEPPQEADELGRLGPYRVLRVIGQGGMGVVLLASDPALRRPVAVKLMLPELAAHPGARERFLREARSAAAVQHENVVVIHAVASGGDLPYLVMEYVPGRSLQHRLNDEGRLPASDVARLGAQIAEGLASAHARGLVHRDVKPANILIDDRTGRAKLTDFGLARGGDDPALTQIGFVAGTPDYIAPEQARGQPVDHRADLYSLGATLFAALAGQPPPNAASTPRPPGRLDADSPSGLRGLAPKAPAALAQLIGRMLAGERDDRPQSAVEVAEALKGLAAPDARPRTAWRSIAAIGLCCAGVTGTWFAQEWRRASTPTGRSVVESAASAPASSGPFVLDGARRFGTLAEAIAEAPSGAVIEVEGDGPHTTTTIHLGRKALTLRAAPGSRPLLVFAPEEDAEPGPSLVAEAALTLEGLNLRSDGQQNGVRGEDPAGFSAIVVRGGPFRAAHCRFEVGPQSACVSLVRSPGEILACQFSAEESMAIAWAPESGQALDLRHTLLNANAPVVIDFARSGSGPGEASLRIDHATLRAFTAVRILTPGGFAPSAHPFLRIRAEGSVFDAPHVLAIVNTATTNRKPNQRPLGVIAQQLRNYLTWRGRDNLYQDSPNWLSAASRGQPIAGLRAGPTSLDEWGRLWGRNEAGSATTSLDFRGPRDAPDPADHALVVPRDDDQASRADPPGADPERVGPGAAYDAWRASISDAPRGARARVEPATTARSARR